MSLKTYLLKALFLAVLSSPVLAADFTIIDVRTPQEYEESHLKDAVLIDIKNPNFRERIATLDKNRAYKLYCRTGNRSGKAMEIMKSLGFTDLENLGGLQEASQKLNQPCEGKKPC